jgi:hypothetical protein
MYAYLDPYEPFAHTEYFCEAHNPEVVYFYGMAYKSAPTWKNVVCCLCGQQDKGFAVRVAIRAARVETFYFPENRQQIVQQLAARLGISVERSEGLL